MMSNRNSRANRVVFCLLIGALAAFEAVAFYPGFMSFDSYEQLNEAMTGVYSDHHPPIMAALWRLLLPLAAGQAPMFLLHLLLFWGSILLLGLTFIDRHPRLAYGFILIWLPPPLLGMTADIWKDSGLAVSWLMLAALMTRYHRLGRPPGRGMTLVLAALFFYGLAVRYNAWTAAWPLLCWLVSLYLRPWRRVMTKIILSLLLLAAGSAAVAVFNDRLVSSRSYLEQDLFLQDIGCISLKVGEPLFPPYIIDKKGLSFLALQRKYRQDDYLLKHDMWEMHSTDPDEIAGLRFYWQQAIQRFPADYFTCRWLSFNELYRWGSPHSYYPYEVRRKELPDDGWVNEARTAAYDAIGRYLALMWGGPWNLPYPWSFLALFLCAFSFLRLLGGEGVAPALDQPIFYLSLSALLYMGGYFFMAWSGDMRYVYWSIEATALAAIFMALQLAEGIKNRKAHV